jgi:hypothetical protein
MASGPGTTANAMREASRIGPQSAIGVPMAALTAVAVNGSANPVRASAVARPCSASARLRASAWVSGRVASAARRVNSPAIRCR